MNRKENAKLTLTLVFILVVLMVLMRFAVRIK